MHAAHPLVLAGARQTGFYERNPWKRMERTLHLTYTMTFGTRRAALEAAERINRVHRDVHGIDAVTGLPYDALDPDLLLWVHACLVDSQLLFEQLTVGLLDPAERERFHQEQMLAAELVRIPREIIPPMVGDLRNYIDAVVASGALQVTDAARGVARLFDEPPRDAQWRPVLKAVSRLAFATSPGGLRDAYGIRSSRARTRAAFA